MGQEQLAELLNNDNFKELLQKLPFAERFGIATSSGLVEEVIISRALKENCFLFTAQETAYIVNDVLLLNKFISLDFNEIWDIMDFSSVPDEQLIQLYLENEIILLDKLKDRGTLFSHIDDFEKAGGLSMMVAISYLHDEDIEKLLSDKKYSSYRYDLVRSFKQEELKIRYLKYLSKYNQQVIISNLSDENKRKFLTPFLFEKGIVISNFSSDEEKDQYLNFYRFMLSDYDKAKIIASFSDINYTIKNSKYLKSQRAKYEYVNIQSNNLSKLNSYGISFFKRMLMSINNEKYLVDLILLQGKSLKKVGLERLIFSMLDKINSQKMLYELFTGSHAYDFNYDEVFDYMFPKMKQSTINKIIKFDTEFLPSYKFLLHVNDHDLLFEALEHYNFKKYNDDMLPLIEKIAKEYNVNLDHLITLSKMTKGSILNQVRNKNIRDALNYDEEDFQKYIKLFDDKKYEIDRNSLSSILNSVLNRQFSVVNPEEIQIFINTLHAVSDGDLDTATMKIRQVLAGVDMSKFDIDEDSLIAGVLNSDPEIVRIYNQITYEYLVNKRNDFVNKRIDSVLGYVLTEEYEINDYLKYIFSVVPEDILYDRIVSEFQNSMGRKYLVNPSLIKGLIHFKKDPSSGLTPEIKPYLKDFNACLKEAFSDDLKCERPKIEGLKTVYKMPDIYPDITDVDVIRNIDAVKFKESVLSNGEIYNELIQYLDRYALMGWYRSYSLGQVVSASDLELLPDTIGSLVSNFSSIMEKKRIAEEKGERFTFASALAYASCFDSDSQIYEQLFGSENYRLLRRNPGPNASPERKSVRLKMALDYLKVGHERDFITVPPVDEDFTLSNGKSIGIMIGNTNDPINLTYGERTGACMRIGGAGRALFDFCLRDENGFHISFSDPKTGDLVSRVSCYRNGNTVFMNQLRFSLSSEYSDDDVKEAAFLIGRKIIELTKDSKYPVMNVVASDDYALRGTKTTDMNCKKTTKGFRHPPYTDVREKVVVVATSGQQLSPVELGPQKAEKYPVGRMRVSRYEEEKAAKAIAHIEALDAFYSDVLIDEIAISEKDVSYACVGEDWYVAITSEGEIIQYVSRTSREPGKANEEMNRYLKILQDEVQYMAIDSDVKGKVI